MSLIALAKEVPHLAFVKWSLLLAAVAVTFVAHCALASPKPSSPARLAWLMVFLAGLLVAVLVVSTPHVSPASGHNEHSPNLLKPCRLTDDLKVVSVAGNVGVAPAVLASAKDGLLATNAQGVVAMEQSGTKIETEPFASLEDVSDIASRGSRTAVVSMGDLRVYNNRTKQLQYTPLPFTDSRTRSKVSLTSEAAWLTNFTYSKVNLVTFDPLEVHTPIQVSGRPTNILAAGGYIWVSMDNGWVARITPATREVADVQIGGEPGPLAGVGDEVWVADGDARRVTRLRPGRIKPLVVGHINHIAGDVSDIVPYRGSVFVASRARDIVQRISSSGAVVDSERVPQGPSDLLVRKGHLYVMSQNGAKVSELRVRVRSVPSVGERLVQPWRPYRPKE